VFSLLYFCRQHYIFRVLELSNESGGQYTRLTIPRSCNYSCTSSWWWVSTPETCRAAYRNIINWIQSHLVGKKAVPLQARKGPEGPRKLRFPDFVTTAQNASKVVSLTHRPPLPPGNIPGTHFWVDPRAIVRSEGFYIHEKSSDTSWDRTSVLPICSTAP